MTGMWLYLENLKCGSKLSDVLCMPEKCSSKKSLASLQDKISESRIVHPVSTPIRELIFRQNYTQTRLYELEPGNPSRKIVEMIFRKASADPARPESRIRSVLKVKNSAQSLERFEKYRDKVKTGASDRSTRSRVDGNELLRFYGTAMACRRDRPKRLSRLCGEPGCRLCRLLQTNFGADFRWESGIRLSSCSDDFGGDDPKETEDSERAVIVCRAIAGSSSSVDNGGFCGSEKQCCNLGSVMVCNPSAVLPCFVIVFH